MKLLLKIDSHEEENQENKFCERKSNKHVFCPFGKFKFSWWLADMPQLMSWNNRSLVFNRYNSGWYATIVFNKICGVFLAGRGTAFDTDSCNVLV